MVLLIQVRLLGHGVMGRGEERDLLGKGELPSAEDTAVIQVGLMLTGTQMLGMDGSRWIQECLRGSGGPRVRRMY